MNKSADVVEYLSQVRAQLGMSQAQMAAALGLPNPDTGGRYTVSAWERRKQAPAPYLTLALDRLLAEAPGVAGKVVVEVAGTMNHVARFSAAHCKPDAADFHQIDPAEEGVYHVEIAGDVAWLQRRGVANVFLFRRVRAEGLDQVADGARVSFLGKCLVLSPDVRALIQAGCVWVNSHNQGYPAAFVVTGAGAETGQHNGRTGARAAG